MPILLSCQTCGRELRVRDELAGQEIYCPDCKSILTVPGVAAPDEPMPQYPSESSSQFTDQPAAPTPIPYSELATDAHLPPEPEDEPSDIFPPKAPLIPPPPPPGQPSIGGIIGGLAMIAGALVLVLIGLITGFWIPRLIVILGIAGIVTLLRGLSGLTSH